MRPMLQFLSMFLWLMPLKQARGATAIDKSNLSVWVWCLNPWGLFLASSSFQQTVRATSVAAPMSGRCKEINVFWLLQSFGDFLSPFVRVIQGKLSLFSMAQVFSQERGNTFCSSCKTASTGDYLNGSGGLGNLFWGTWNVSPAVMLISKIQLTSLASNSAFICRSEKYLNLWFNWVTFLVWLPVLNPWITSGVSCHGHVCVDVWKIKFHQTNDLLFSMRD